jgi:RHS repeat-associated protein
VTTITRVAYDDANVAWADLNGSNVVQVRYLAGPMVNQWFARIDVSGAEWLLTDRLGSIRDVTASAGTTVLDHTEHYAFGGVISDTNVAVAGTIGWQGMWQDRTTNGVASTTRVWDTRTIQWRQEDFTPIQFDAADGNYRRPVGNDPVNATDPSGLEPPPMSRNPEPPISLGRLKFPEYMPPPPPPPPPPRTIQIPGTEKKIPVTGSLSTDSDLTDDKSEGLYILAQDADLGKEAHILFSSMEDLKSKLLEKARGKKVKVLEISAHGNERRMRLGSYSPTAGGVPNDYELNSTNSKAFGIWLAENIKWDEDPLIILSSCESGLKKSESMGQRLADGSKIRVAAPIGFMVGDVLKGNGRPSKTDRNWNTQPDSETTYGHRDREWAIYRPNELPYIWKQP